MTTELWIDSDYLTEIWGSLDKDKIVIRSEFDEDTKQYIKSLYREIQIVKQDGYQKKGKSTKTD